MNTIRRIIGQFLSDSVICQRCGEKYPAHYNQCPECHTFNQNVEEPPIDKKERIRCWNCGYLYPEYWGMCPECCMHPKSE